MPDATTPTDPPTPGLRPVPPSGRPSVAARTAAATAAARAAQERAAGPKPVTAPARRPVTEEERERGRMIGLAAVGFAAVVAVVVTIGIFLPAMGALTSGGIRPVDEGSLPALVTVCDREYARSPAPVRSAGDVRASDGADPVVVAAGSSCPSGVCATNGACLTVVYVQTTDDRFAAYEQLDESS